MGFGRGFRRFLKVAEGFFTSDGVFVLVFRESFLRF